MKTRYYLITIILPILIILMSGVTFSFDFEINALDNPAPGYIRLAWNSSTDFFLVDNSGKTIYNKTTQGTANHYILLSNGNWAQKESEKYLIYNEELELIDTVPNPTISNNNPSLLEWHDFILLSNGHYLILLNQHNEMDLSTIVDGGRSNAIVNANLLIETDRTGTIYWQWNSMDHLNILEVTEDIDLTQQVIDMTHINSFQEDTDGNLIISIRHYDEICKINKSTGNFIWRFGGSKCINNQFTILNDDQNGFKGFSHQHSVRLIDGSRLLLYDNGNLKTLQYSRAVEYQMDFTNKTATKIWEAVYSPVIYQGAMGSVQRLPNGNTLVNWGTSAITEYKPNNQIAFNLKFSEIGYRNVYSAYRVATKMESGSNIVSSTGEYLYNSSKTGIKLNITSLSGQGYTSIEKHFYSASNLSFTDSTFTNLIPLRWVFSKNGINSISGKINFNLNNISGIQNPSKAIVYKRLKEGSEEFAEIPTYYNSSSNELIADFSGSGEFIIGTTSLTKPNLLSPLNNSNSLNYGLLSWSKVTGAQGYQIQISKNADFSQFISNKYVQNSISVKYDSLEFLTFYYWRVRALNSKDTSEWSNTFKFKTNLALPVLTYPANNSIGFRITDSLKWVPVLTAEKYKFQMSSNKYFSDLIYDEEVIGTNSIQPKMLRYNTIYYWRVIAYSKDLASDWSEVWAFKTIMDTPVLTNPINDSINVPINLSLKWTGVNGASNYIIQLSKGKELKEIFKTSISDISQLNVEGLEYSSEYSWRVRAYKSVDSSDWSDIKSFSTRLKSPQLISPENQLANVPLSCLLSWDDINPDAQFTCQLSKTSDFSGTIQEFKVSNKNSLQLTDLHANTKYYWRVKSTIGLKESDWSIVWSFNTTKGFAVIQPKLISPKNNAEVYVRGILTWTNSEGAKNYRVQIAKEQSFSTIVKDTSVSGILYYQFYKLSFETKYYWRVKAYSTSDSSDWSSMFIFKVSKQSDIIKLISPSNDEMQVVINGRLTWEAMPGALGYNVQLSKNQSFDENLFNLQSISGTSIEYSNLELNEEYYWRVRFLREYDTSSWSQVWSFYTSTSSVLSVPKLLSPGDGSIPVEINGDIKWEHSANADRYLVQISTSPTFDSMKVKTIEKEHSFHYSDFDNNTQYFWRIAAINDSSKSYWSQISNFTTLLESPQIIYPRDNAVSVPINFEFLWKVNEDISEYILQIASDLEFKDILFDIKSIGELGYNISLDFNRTYYCRVKAVNEVNYSHWSDIIKFTTFDPNSISEDKLYNISYYPNPVQTYLTVDLNSSLSLNGMKIKVVNLLGNEVYENCINTAEKSLVINMERQNSGVYFLILENRNYRKVFNFIKY